jgi:hypothetical protein
VDVVRVFGSLLHNQKLYANVLVQGKQTSSKEKLKESSTKDSTVTKELIGNKGKGHPCTGNEALYRLYCL